MLVKKPRIEINGEIIPILPNSFVFRRGKGNNDVKSGAINIIKKKGG
jgi:hypothetical protein